MWKRSTACSASVFQAVVYTNTRIRGSCGVYETLHLLATLLTDLLIDGAIERNFCSPHSAPSAYWPLARSPEHIDLHHSYHTVPISRHIVKLFQMASINILYDKLVEVHCLESHFFILLTVGRNFLLVTCGAWWGRVFRGRRDYNSLDFFSRIQVWSFWLLLNSSDFNTIHQPSTEWNILYWPYELHSNLFQGPLNRTKTYRHVNDTDNQANNGLSKFVMLFFPDENKFTW